jgi:imidazole glycerol-phosphate synthase subunit HisF
MTFGSSTISVCLDVKHHFWGKSTLYIRNGTVNTGFDPKQLAKKMEHLGVGELIIQSIGNDGKMNGYDLDLLKTISETVSIPAVALGGAANLESMKQAYQATNISALAAGSMFIYQGKNKGVLINYPTKDQRKKW